MSVSCSSDFSCGFVWEMLLTGIIFVLLFVAASGKSMLSAAL